MSPRRCEYPEILRGAAEMRAGTPPKQEREEPAALLEQLTNSDTAGARRSLLAKIKAALGPHVRAEEKVVYDAIIALRGNEAKQNGEEGYLEYSLADRILATL